MTRESTYTRTAITLHWIVAALLLGNIVLALVAEQLPDAWIRPAIDAHKSIGITVLGLVLLRLLWRAANPPPPWPEQMSRLEAAAAHAGHVLLYMVMIALPLSGWLHDSAWKDAASHPLRLFGVVAWPRIGWITHLPADAKEFLHDRLGLLHRWMSYGFYALFLTHLVAALRHQLRGEPCLQRMGLRRRAPAVPGERARRLAEHRNPGAVAPLPWRRS
jgi:cytochrome b561